MDKAEFEARISATSDRIKELKDEELNFQTKLGQALRAGNDKKAEECQDDREKVKKELERRHLELEALENQRAGVEREEAKALMINVLDEYTLLLVRKHQVIDELNGLLKECYPLAEESAALLLKLNELRDKAEYLSVKYGLIMPASFKAPPKPQEHGLGPLCFKTKAKIDSEEMGSVSRSAWAQKTGQLKHERKKEIHELNKKPSIWNQGFKIG